jgi:NAD(P)H-hydrate repair Nnr-like enzyme with NAD(P)H-hydrate epimerase domain
MFEKWSEVSASEYRAADRARPNALDSPSGGDLSADVIVDAILGTGFRPPVSPLYAAAIAR